MKLKFPNLGKLLNSDKKLDENAPSKLIHVQSGHAIVINEGIVCVNLREYVKTECSITNEKELEDLTEVINWMEGKSFSKTFWTELTKEVYVELQPDGLTIDYPSYQKVLVYEDIVSDTEEQFAKTEKEYRREEVATNRIAINGKVLTSITDALKSELKGDQVMFRFSGKENGIVFSCRRREYIFGLIPSNYDAASEFTAFMNVTNFVDSFIAR